MITREEALRRLSEIIAKAMRKMKGIVHPNILRLTHMKLFKMMVLLDIVKEKDLKIAVS
jgi:hypothetical protein